MKFVPAAFETEVIKDTTRQGDLAKAKRRGERIAMSAVEAEIYCENPNAQTENPGYPDPTYGDR
jgi:hypothetical protein